MSKQKEVAVITGATSGIGLGVAENLLKNGYNVVLNGRNGEKLKNICEQLNCKGVAGDITEKGMPEMILAETIREYGRCDILINNAGVMVQGTIEEIDIDKMGEMIRINVEAAFRMTYLFLRHFIKKNSGHIINISSILGTKVREAAGAYAGTKHALEALTEALRMELAHTDVKITALEPGLVKSELHRHWDVHPMDSLEISEPLMPSDMADTILWILQRPKHVRIEKILVLPSGQAI
jgi:NADP-dependent 3-hydroxy acid dehydrogenase YdfG